LKGSRSRVVVAALSLSGRSPLGLLFIFTSLGGVIGSIFIRLLLRS
jgi:hypothetical protein